MSSRSSDSPRHEERYVSATHRVTLRVVEAHNLHKVTRMFKQKPFVQVRMHDTIRETRKDATEGGLDADFEQKFIMQGNPNFDAIELIVKHSSLMSDKPIGCTTIPLNVLPPGRIVDEWFTLWGNKGLPFGAIRLRIHLQPNKVGVPDYEMLPSVPLSYGDAAMLQPGVLESEMSRAVILRNLPLTDVEFAERALYNSLAPFGKIERVIVQFHRHHSMHGLVLFESEDSAMRCLQQPHKLVLGRRINADPITRLGEILRGDSSRRGRRNRRGSSSSSSSSSSEDNREHMSPFRAMREFWSRGFWLGMKGVAHVRSFTERQFLRSPIVYSVRDMLERSTDESVPSIYTQQFGLYNASEPLQGGQRAAAGETVAPVSQLAGTKAPVAEDRFLREAHHEHKKGGMFHKRTEEERRREEELERREFTQTAQGITAKPYTGSAPGRTVLAEESAVLPEKRVVETEEYKREEHHHRA